MTFFVSTYLQPTFTNPPSFCRTSYFFCILPPLPLSLLLYMPEVQMSHVQKHVPNLFLIGTRVVVLYYAGIVDKFAPVAVTTHDHGTPFIIISSILFTRNSPQNSFTLCADDWNCNNYQQNISHLVVRLVSCSNNTPIPLTAYSSHWAKRFRSFALRRTLML